MRFNHMGKRITLNGIKDCTTSCTKLKVKKLNGLLRKGGVAQLHLTNVEEKQATQTMSNPT